MSLRDGLRVLAKLLYKAEVKIAYSLGINLGPGDFILISDRAIEYGFVMRELEIPQQGRILDVGFASSPLPFILAGLNCEIHAVDQRKAVIEYPNLRLYECDIRHTPFPDSFFDRVIAVSVIEHIGLSGCYGSDEYIDGDIKAIKEMTRILKDDGIMLITVPFGRAAVKKYLTRIYDTRGLEKLFSGLKCLKKEYAKMDGPICRSASVHEVENTKGYHAIALLKLCKK